MKESKIPFLSSFQVRVTMLLVFSLLFIACLSNFLVYKFSYDAQFNQLRDKLKVIAQTAALAVDTDLLLQVPLIKEGKDSPAYKIISDKLMQIKKANQPIKYIYTMTKTEKEGIWQFIVDPDLPTKEQLTAGITAFPGDGYDASRFPEMLKAFEAPSADRELEVDEWGATLSGYSPIRDKNGKAVAILGVDLMADDVYAIQKELQRRGIFVLIVGIMISVLLGILISNRITKPIKKLVEGTYHIGNGDLAYRVAIKGKDEIGELAKSFNQMAGNLYELRKKLLSFFYRVAQSLVRILEAKDHYTRGHSERVSEYSEKIARRMQVSDDKIELLKEAAVLHDIGKIGIQESILNKKGKLTEEEWEIIQKHPIIGEDIIKPISLSDEMMAIVRGHHERYDGEGYPDKISGENINLFAAIVSVADAYDAMISPRAYRPALSRQETIDELKRNRGIQFRPEIVDVLLEVLEEESNI